MQLGDVLITLAIGALWATPAYLYVYVAVVVSDWRSNRRRRSQIGGSMAHNTPHPNVVRRRAQLAARHAVVNMGRVVAAREEHKRTVALMAEKAAQARARTTTPAIPQQRTGPARDARGRFASKVSA